MNLHDASDVKWRIITKLHHTIYFGVISLMMLSTLIAPTSALLHSKNTFSIRQSQPWLAQNLVLSPAKNLNRLRSNVYGLVEQQQKHARRTITFCSSVTDEHLPEESEPKTELKPLKEDEDFIKAVEEVKDAALNVTESSVKLTSTIVTRGPGIIGRLLQALVAKEFRYVASQLKLVEYSQAYQLHSYLYCYFGF